MFYNGCRKMVRDFSSDGQAYDLQSKSMCFAGGDHDVSLEDDRDRVIAQEALERSDAVGAPSQYPGCLFFSWAAVHDARQQAV